jgi:hypothetical protein
MATDEATNEMRARCALLRERFAAMGGVLECGQIAKALGVHCAGHPHVKPRTKRAALAGKSLARAGWMGYPAGAAPFGVEATDRHQVEWVKRVGAKTRPVVTVTRRKRKLPLTEIAKQMPAKLPKLPKKYGWQKD